MQFKCSGLLWTPGRSYTTNLSTSTAASQVAVILMLSNRSRPDNPPKQQEPNTPSPQQQKRHHHVQLAEICRRQAGSLTHLIDMTWFKLLQPMACRRPEDKRTEGLPAKDVNRKAKSSSSSAGMYRYGRHGCRVNHKNSTVSASTSLRMTKPGLPRARSMRSVSDHRHLHHQHGGRNLEMLAVGKVDAAECEQKQVL